MPSWFQRPGTSLLASTARTPPVRRTPLPCRPNYNSDCSLIAAGSLRDVEESLLADLIALRLEMATRAGAIPKDVLAAAGIDTPGEPEAMTTDVEMTPRAERTAPVVNSRSFISRSSLPDLVPRAPSPTHSVISFQSTVNTIEDPFEGVLPDATACHDSKQIPSLGVWTRTYLHVAAQSLKGVTYEAVDAAWTQSGGNWKTLDHFLRVRGYSRGAVGFLGAMVRLDVEEVAYGALPK